MPTINAIARSSRVFGALSAGFLVASAGVLGATAATAAPSTVPAQLPGFVQTATDGECTISGARLDWGFKESFRAYVSGTIARGSWSTADGATYETPLFSWHEGAGSVSAELDSGEVAFGGSINFTGHGGILNTTVANPVLRFDGATLMMSVDISGETRDGEPVAETGVEFAQFDLAAGQSTADGDTRVLSAVPGAFTAAGAEAFGTYPEGEALDPITVTLPGATECATEDEAAGPGATDDEDAPAATDQDDEVVTSTPNMEAGPDMSWLPWVIGGVVVVGIGGIFAWVARARSRN